MKNEIKRALRGFGIHLIGSRTINYLEGATEEIEGLFEFVLSATGVDAEHSKAQLKQDVAALIANRFKRGGYFVEFGAANGLDLSNTYLLEKQFDWVGVLAEPSPPWHVDLRKNRSCSIDYRCVWRSSGERLDFNVVDIGEFSTIQGFADSDHNRKIRSGANTVIVDSVSLEDLLIHHGAPREVDFLSIDTEGSEFEILNAFDFQRFSFNFITVEHNFTENRANVTRLLEANGYRRLFESVSRWDDWFVRN